MQKQYGSRARRYCLSVNERKSHQSHSVGLKMRHRQKRERKGENCCLSYDSIYLVVAVAVAVLDKRQFTSTNEHSYRTDSLSSDWFFVKMVCRRRDRSQSLSENDFDPCWIPEWAQWWSPTIIQSDRYSTSSDLFFNGKKVSALNQWIDEVL